VKQPATNTSKCRGNSGNRAPAPGDVATRQISGKPAGRPAEATYTSERAFARALGLSERGWRRLRGREDFPHDIPTEPPYGPVDVQKVNEWRAGFLRPDPSLIWRRERSAEQGRVADIVQRMTHSNWTHHLAHDLDVRFRQFATDVADLPQFIIAELVREYGDIEPPPALVSALTLLDRRLGELLEREADAAVAFRKKFPEPPRPRPSTGEPLTYTGPAHHDDGADDAEADE
jgi:hypothetical protein